MIRAVIIGVTGRMGRALVRAASEMPDVRVTGAIASSVSAALGQDAGELAGAARVGVPVTADLAAALAAADVAIDFSQPQATRLNLSACRAAGKPLLIGTTGFGAELGPVLEAAVADIPLLVAPNTSLGVTLLIELVRAAAASLPPEFDIEIIEAHHRMKKDAPSGTALALGRAAEEGRSAVAGHGGWSTAEGGRTPAGAGHGAAAGHGGGSAVGGGAGARSEVLTDRSGLRREGDIGYAVVRGGDIVGEHTVLFAGRGEQVTLGHRATDRGIFARGALRAALWLAGQPPGRYAMRDVLGRGASGILPANSVA